VSVIWMFISDLLSVPKPGGVWPPLESFKSGCQGGRVGV
jgi:hypothetical protein